MSRSKAQLHMCGYTNCLGKAYGRYYERSYVLFGSRVSAAQVSAGSADRMVYIWDAASRALLYQLPGHSGSVNETAFHPSEPIILSAGSDKQLYLGELVL